MPAKIKVKAIMYLRDSGMSQRSIAISSQTSRNSIRDVFRIAKTQSVTWHQIKDLEESEVYEMFFPVRFKRVSIQKEADYDYVHKELKKVGVTLKFYGKNMLESVKMRIVYHSAIAVIVMDTMDLSQ